MAKIYTKTGDAGQTGLFGGDRVSKTHRRVEAYGGVEELNCALGWALIQVPTGLFPLREALIRVQRELFTVGALLATPPAKAGRLKGGLPADAVSRLEREIDQWTGELPPLSRFILPGGGAAGAALHLARAVCRRAERAVVALTEEEKAPERVLPYLNRLSDHLFTAARWANARLRAGETAWEGLAS